MLLDDPYAAVDRYCERVDASFWSEPLNAVSNAAFLVAAGLALLAWVKAGPRDRAALWLVLLRNRMETPSFLLLCAGTLALFLCVVITRAVNIPINAAPSITMGAADHSVSVDGVQHVEEPVLSGHETPVPPDYNANAVREATIEYHEVKARAGKVGEMIPLDRMDALAAAV